MQIAGKLDAIEQRLARRQGRRVAADCAAIESQNGGAGEAHDAEEDERAAWLLRIQSAVYRAMETQPLLATEIALVELAAKQAQGNTPQTTRELAQSHAGHSSSGGGTGQMAAAAAAVVLDSLANVSLASQRQRLRSEVFRPSHILPTMTIEQFGELERQRMEEASRRQAECDARQAAAQTDARSDDEADEDARVAKARAWDDWKVCCDPRRHVPCECLN